MSRNFKVAAVALALAGGVYLAGSAPAEASNMGFKLERSFDLVRNTASGRPLQNIYWVSHPYFNGLGDVADGAATSLSKCVGDADGPASGDGTIDSYDAICDMWTARSNRTQAGAFSFSYFKSLECVPVSHNASVGLGGRLSFAGTPFTLTPDIGYQVIIGVPPGATYSPQNRAVIVGSHDPAFTGHAIVAAPNCVPPNTTNCCGPTAGRLDMINLPYHTMYTRAYELLCGLEGVDWVDADANGRPDTCTGGIYDGAHGIAVNYFNNTEAINAPVSASVAPGIGGRPNFAGTNYNLVPGDAYLVNIPALQTPTNFISPHY